MSIKHEPGEGQHVICRIEWKDWATSAVRRAEYEDSDDRPGDNIATVGWAIRWALDMLHGNDAHTIQTLAEALHDCCEGLPEGFADDGTPEDKAEREHLEACWRSAVAFVRARRERRHPEKRAKPKRAGGAPKSTEAERMDWIVATLTPGTQYQLDEVYNEMVSEGLFAKSTYRNDVYPGLCKMLDAAGITYRRTA